MFEDKREEQKKTADICHRIQGCNGLEFGFFVLYFLLREEEEPNIGPIFGREYSKQ
jgi:hypothetical protein